jgi:hypothetical protein
LFFERHGWLEVEGGKERENSSREETGGVKKESDPYPPFYKTRVAGYMSEERENEKEGGCACVTGVRLSPTRQRNFERQNKICLTCTVLQQICIRCCLQQL